MQLFDFTKFYVFGFTMPKKFVALPTTLLATTMALAGCNNANDNTNNNPEHDNLNQQSEQAHKNHQIDEDSADYTAVLDSNYPPYSLRDEMGHANGFDADILRAIAERQGFTVSISPSSWDVIYDGMFNKSHDIVMGGMSPLDIEQQEHLENYEHSSPYAYGEDAIATLPHITDIRRFEDLKNHNVSTLGDSAYTAELNKLFNNRSTGNIIEEPSLFLAFQDMIQGTSEAVLSDKGVLNYYKINFPETNFDIHQEGEYLNEPYEMVYWVNKDKPELQDKIKMGVEQIIADGSYQQIYQKWFGVEPNILPTKHAETE